MNRMQHRKARQNFCLMSNGTRIRVKWGQKDKLKIILENNCIHLVLIYKKRLYCGVKIHIIGCFYVYLLNVVY